MIGVIAILRTKEGTGPEFEAAFGALAAAVRANEPGNLVYQLTRSRTEPGVYKVLEVYKDEDAIAAQPPHALRLAKSLLKQGQTASYDTVMEMSAAAQAISHMTEDHMEGVDALLEKRPAVFKGR